jgi:hypothetical protein
VLEEETREAVRAIRAQRRREWRRQRRRAQASQDGRADAGGACEAAVGAVQLSTEDPVVELECTICFEGLDPDDHEAGPAATLPCAHSFHGGCIEHWLATCDSLGVGKTCPNCRVECPDFVP